MNILSEGDVHYFCQEKDSSFLLIDCYIPSKYMHVIKWNSETKEMIRVDDSCVQRGQILDVNGHMQ